MITPKIFYEHSVNRPIYLEKGQVEAIIRSKKTKVQHAFLTVSIKQVDIIQSVSGAAKDSLGQDTARIREGSLHFNKLISFTHNEHVYIINKNGELIKQS